MPDVAAGIAVEADDDAGDHAGLGADGIFPSCFGRFGGYGLAGEFQLFFAEVGEGLETATVENLKFDEMKMDGMRIVRGIDQVPDFDGIEKRIFGDRHMPGRIVEQHLDRVLYQVVYFVEREHACFHCGRFGEFFYRPQDSGQGGTGFLRQRRC